jgi:hypothetical protein
VQSDKFVEDLKPFDVSTSSTRRRLRVKFEDLNIVSGLACYDSRFKIQDSKIQDSRFKNSRFKIQDSRFIRLRRTRFKIQRLVDLLMG